MEYQVILLLTKANVKGRAKAQSEGAGEGSSNANKNKAVTVICPAHKLALNGSPVCSIAGSHQVQSSTQQNEVAQSAAIERYKDTILLELRGVCTAAKFR